MNINYIHKLFVYPALFALTIILYLPAKGAPNYSKWQTPKQYHSTDSTNYKAFNEKDSVDAKFVKRVSEANLAQIELGEVALQKAVSEEVKEYAQTMIEHHTMTQTGLAAIVINHPNSAGSSPGAGMNDANEETTIQSPTNDADKTSTLGGTGGTTGNAMAEGMTNGEYNSSLPKKSNTGTSEDSQASTRAPGNTNASPQANNNVNPAESTPTIDNTSTSNQGSTLTYELLKRPSPEQKALIDKLAALSRAEFERQYIQVMIKEHAKTVELFEKYAIDTKAKDDLLTRYASKNLPLIKKHYIMAKELNNKAVNENSENIK